MVVVFGLKQADGQQPVQRPTATKTRMVLFLFSASTEKWSLCETL